MSTQALHESTHSYTKDTKILEDLPDSGSFLESSFSMCSPVLRGFQGSELVSLPAHRFPNVQIQLLVICLTITKQFIHDSLKDVRTALDAHGEPLVLVLSPR